jgi:hypothetical protein
MQDRCRRPRNTHVARRALARYLFADGRPAGLGNPCRSAYLSTALWMPSVDLIARQPWAFSASRAMMEGYGSPAQSCW